MYFSMVHSHLNYGLFAWGFDSKRIIKLQKRCVRIITRSTYSAHTQPLMKKLNILSVPDILLLNSMKFYYKYKHNEVLDCFTSFNLHTQGSTHDYNTHHRDDIRTNRVRINLTEKCLRNYLQKTRAKLSWAQVVLGTSCLGYELSWVRVVLGTSCPGYELFWVRVVHNPVEDTEKSKSIIQIQENRKVNSSMSIPFLFLQFSAQTLVGSSYIRFDYPFLFFVSYAKKTFVTIIYKAIHCLCENANILRRLTFELRGQLLLKNKHLTYFRVRHHRLKPWTTTFWQKCKIPWLIYLEFWGFV